MPQDHEHKQLNDFSRIGSNVVDAQGKPLVVLQGARPGQDATSEALQDCKTHYQAWRSALTNAQHSAKGEADISYWGHEIAAFDRTFKALNAQPAQPAPASVAGMAQILGDRPAKEQREKRKPLQYLCSQNLCR